MRMLLSFVLLLICAGANAYFAKQRGRDPVAWFLIGLLLGVFGLLVLVLMPKLSTKSDLEQDEDRILAGIGISNNDFISKEWLYLDEARQQVGPIFFKQLCKIYEEGKISDRTYVWCEGMKEWERIGNMPVLQEAIEMTQSPVNMEEIPR